MAYSEIIYGIIRGNSPPDNISIGPKAYYSTSITPNQLLMYNER